MSRWKWSPWYSRAVAERNRALATYPEREPLGLAADVARCLIEFRHGIDPARIAKLDWRKRWVTVTFHDGSGLSILIEPHSRYRPPHTSETLP